VVAEQPLGRPVELAIAPSASIDTIASPADSITYRTFLASRSVSSASRRLRRSSSWTRLVSSRIATDWRWVWQSAS